jgi:hypothetical protein
MAIRVQRAQRIVDFIFFYAFFEFISAKVLLFYEKMSFLGKKSFSLPIKIFFLPQEFYVPRPETYVPRPATQVPRPAT